MKSIRNLILAALVLFTGAAAAAPTVAGNPGYGYMGYQNGNTGGMGMNIGPTNPGYGYVGFQDANTWNTGMANIFVDIFPFAQDVMAGIELDGYVVANVPGLGGMYIFTADAGWQVWDLKNLVPAVRLTNCTFATSCTQAHFEILHSMDLNDPAVQAMLNGATIYVGYGRIGEGVRMDRVRQFTTSDMVYPGMPISMDPTSCFSEMQKSRFCM